MLQDDVYIVKQNIIECQIEFVLFLPESGIGLILLRLTVISSSDPLELLPFCPPSVFTVNINNLNKLGI